MTTPPSREEVARAISSITGEPMPHLPVADEAVLLAHFLQGTLLGCLLRERAEDRLALKIANIEPAVSSQGDYEDHFIVTTDSGIKLRVTVTPEA